MHEFFLDADIILSLVFSLVSLVEPVAVIVPELFFVGVLVDFDIPILDGLRHHFFPVLDQLIKFLIEDV